MKTQIRSLAIISVAVMALSGCFGGGSAGYVRPSDTPLPTFAQLRHGVSSPQPVRLAISYTHNGEAQHDNAVPFRSYAPKFLAKSGLFQVVEDDRAPVLELVLRSTVDPAAARSAILTAGLTVGMGEAYVERQYTLQATLGGKTALSSQELVLTTKKALAPVGAEPLGLVDSQQGVYDALLLKALWELKQR